MAGFTTGKILKASSARGITDGYDFVDEDDMSSDSDTSIPSQQSVKAYVDSVAAAWDGDIADIDLDGGDDIGAALADADLILVDDGGAGTNRKAAVTRIPTYVESKSKLDDFQTPDDNTDLNATTTYHGLCPKLSNTATEYLDGTGSWSTPAGGSGSSRWTEISTDDYTATPSDTDTLAMSDTSAMAVGLPVKYTIGGTDYFGQVVAVSANTSIDIRGASMGGDVTALYVGTPEMVLAMSWFVGGAYGAATEDDCLRDIMDSPVKWQLGTAYCVGFEGSHSGVDTGTEPKVNIHINNAAVSTNDTNAGIQLGAADTWVGNSAVAINTSNYDINYDEELEISVTAAGGTGDALNLTMQVFFVFA